MDIRHAGRAIWAWAVGNLLWNGVMVAWGLGGSAVITAIVGALVTGLVGIPTAFLVLMLVGVFLLALAGMGEMGQRLHIGRLPNAKLRTLPEAPAPPRPKFVTHIPKVVEIPGRVSVTEDIDADYFRLKVTNLADERQEFEVKFLDFHGTGQRETDYAARWRGTGNPGQRLKAKNQDYINAVECLGPIDGQGAALRFYTADLPTSPSSTSHYFDRQISAGFAVMWTFEVHVEPPLANPLRHTCTLKIDGNGWVEDFAIDKSYGGVTGPAMSIP